MPLPHCFFSEPTKAPCVLLGLYTGLHNGISVKDIGLGGATEADGLVVGRASGFIGRLIEPMLAGCFTVTDEKMIKCLKMLSAAEGISLEPSALAGMYGIVLANERKEFRSFIKDKNATRIVWTTGGGMVPREEMKKYLIQ